MKKTLVLAAIASLLATSTTVYASTTEQKTPVKKQPVCEKMKPADKQDMKRHQRPNLDERLKLTEEQKAKAQELRMKGHEKIKPVMEKIKAKHEEIRKIAENTNLTQEQKDKKIFSVEKELLNLKQQARKIRTENMKQFESILTDEQKAELEKIKQEAQAMRAKGPHHGPKGAHRPHHERPLGDGHAPEAQTK